MTRALSLAAGAIAAAAARVGRMPHRLVELTNARYDHDCFWGGPGWPPGAVDHG